MNPFQVKVTKEKRETLAEDLGISDERGQEIRDHVESNVENIINSDSSFSEDMHLLTSICKNLHETVYTTYIFTALIIDLDNLSNINKS